MALHWPKLDLCNEHQVSGLTTEVSSSRNAVRSEGVASHSLAGRGLADADDNFAGHVRMQRTEVIEFSHLIEPMRETVIGIEWL